METLLARTAKIAQHESTVLITGETGTGKTTLAKQIHNAGPRAHRPFVVVNCASLPRELIESELFGHTRGAFTGAVSDRPGRAEIAHEGTLLLDEIGDLPLELQPKLLAFLQDRTFHRIGSNEARQVDVRIIAATHRDLATLSREGKFREDLFYRLSVLTLHVPPLRERRREIPDLIGDILLRIYSRSEFGEFLETGAGTNPSACAEGAYGSDAGSEVSSGRAFIPEIEDEAMADLVAYDWPGNVRELENVLERAGVFCDGRRITRSDLLFDVIRAFSDSSRSPTSARLAGKSLAEIESLAIRQTLDACGGNKAQAARQLGISERGIYNKIKRYGLSAPYASPQRVSNGYY